MASVITIIQQSGGVGKSTSNFNLSHIFADLGYKTLSLENETQSDLMSFFFGRDNELNTITPTEILTNNNNNIIIGDANTSKMYQENAKIVPVKIKDNLHYIGSTKHLSNILTMSFDEVAYNFIDNINKLKKDFDIILIDCPPTESNLQKSALMASDYVLIPTLLEPKSLGGIARTIQLVNHIKKIKSISNMSLDILGIFVSEYSHTKKLDLASSRVLERVYNEKLIDLYKNNLLTSRISSSIKICESTALQLSIVDYAKDTKEAQKVANEYLSLAIEILNKIKNK